MESDEAWKPAKIVAEKGGAGKRETRKATLFMVWNCNKRRTNDHYI